VRFALAAILLVGFALWWNQNGGQAALKEASDLRGAREDVTITAQKKDVSHAIETFKEVDFKMKGNQPLRTKWLPDRISDIVGTWNGGIAGAMLLLSLCFWGKRMGLGVILGAGIALLAYRYRIPFVEGNTMLAGIAGVIVSLLSIMFFRQKKGL
jgi:hypothetical protein